MLSLRTCQGQGQGQGLTSLIFRALKIVVDCLKLKRHIESLHTYCDTIKAAIANAELRSKANVKLTIKR